MQGQAGPCFHESLIVESCLFTGRHLSIRLGNKAHPAVETLTVDIGRYVNSVCQGGVFVSSGCLLALLPCHRPSPIAIERAFSTGCRLRRLWKTLPKKSPYGVTIREDLWPKTDLINGQRWPAISHIHALQRRTSGSASHKSGTTRSAFSIHSVGQPLDPLAMRDARERETRELPQPEESAILP